MTPRERLKLARELAGYPKATDAARAHSYINQNTLISHENGNRDISRKAAEKYARAFNVDAGWILYGEGEGPSESAPERRIEFNELFSRIGEKDQDAVLKLLRSLASAKGQ